MKKILKSIIILLIEVIEKYEYRNLDLDEHDISKKILNYISTNNLLVESDNGFVPVSEINITQPYQQYELILENGLSMVCADNHIVFDENYNEIFVRDVLYNNIQTKYGISKVISVKKLKGKISMFDLSIDSNEHRYFTNNILSHNTVNSAIIILHFCLFNNDKGCMIVANKSTTVVEIIDKIKNIYKELPFFLKKGVNVWNLKSITFDNGCRIRSENRTKEPAIGFTIDFLYLDEFAKIPQNYIRPYYRSVLPIVSAIDNSKIIITSTPDGFNLFYELFTEAEAGRSRYKAKRIYWYQVPGRRDVKIYFNEYLEQYNLNIKDVINELKTKYNYTITEKSDDDSGDVAYVIKYINDEENTNIDFVRTLRVENNIPLLEIAKVTNWKEEQIALLGSEDDFRQEFNIEFITSSRQLFDDVMMEQIRARSKPFEFIQIPKFDNKMTVSYASLKWLKDLDLTKAKDEFITIGVDLGDGLGKDYSVINIFKLNAKNEDVIRKQAKIYEGYKDFFKLEQIGLFRNNYLSLKEISQILYMIVFELFDPDKCKVVIEWNKNGGELFAHLPNVFDGYNDYTNIPFVKFKHNQNDKIKKLGLYVSGGEGGKKLLIKNFQDATKYGNVVLNEESSIHEVTLFTKKETPSGDFTYKSETGNDDVVMSTVDMCAIFDSNSYKDLIDGFMSKSKDHFVLKLIEQFMFNVNGGSNNAYSVFTTIHSKTYKTSKKDVSEKNDIYDMININPNIRSRAIALIGNRESSIPDRSDGKLC